MPRFDNLPFRISYCQLCGITGGLKYKYTLIQSDAITATTIPTSLPWNIHANNAKHVTSRVKSPQRSASNFSLNTSNEIATHSPMKNTSMCNSGKRPCSLQSFNHPPLLTGNYCSCLLLTHFSSRYYNTV